MDFPKDLKYTSSHEWIKMEGDVVTIGITDHAQNELGDVVFVELPEMGADLSRGDTFGTIEAVKTVADLYAPVSGKVIEVNAALQDDASAVNSDPYGSGWIVKLQFTSLDGELLDSETYKGMLE